MMPNLKLIIVMRNHLSSITSSSIIPAIGLLFSLIVAQVVVNSQAFALATDKDQAIEILADSAERDEKLGVTTYEGNVEIQQGSLKIKANKVTIKTSANANDNKQSLDGLVASGTPAFFSQQLAIDGDYVEASADTIRYTTSDRIVQLHHQAMLNQTGNVITGNRIVYDMAAQRVQARGEVDGNKTSERVRVIIPPKKTTQSGTLTEDTTTEDAASNSTSANSTPDNNNSYDNTQDNENDVTEINTTTNGTSTPTNAPVTANNADQTPSAEVNNNTNTNTPSPNILIEDISPRKQTNTGSTQ